MALHLFFGYYGKKKPIGTPHTGSAHPHRACAVLHYAGTRFTASGIISTKSEKNQVIRKIEHKLLYHNTHLGRFDDRMDRCGRRPREFRVFSIGS